MIFNRADKAQGARSSRTLLSSGYAKLALPSGCNTWFLRPVLDFWLAPEANGSLVVGNG